MILQFAWRYFKGKKSTRAINMISWVSMGAMAVSTAALIIVLSVFNGFESFIKNLYSGFYPDIRVAATVGKTFSADSIPWNQIRAMNEVADFSQTLEEKILYSFDENQAVATLKGVDQFYDTVTHIQKSLQYGTMFSADTQEVPELIIGKGLSNRLGANDESVLPLSCYSFNEESLSETNLTQSYNNLLFMVKGVFMLQEDIDNQYAIAPLSFVQSLSGREGRISAIEIRLKEHADADRVAMKLRSLLPASFKTETRYEQNKTLYFIMASERWAVFAILTMMLIIASFNIIGSLSMLVIDKEKDIAILKSMGIRNGGVQRLFLTTGLFISMSGALIGMALAWLICWAQKTFGIIKLGSGGSYLIDAYPVEMRLLDFLLVMATVFLISLLAAWFPAYKAAQKPIELRVK
ncbi:MAG: ABC transporter permease [Chitinophagaceae bacterium]|nr:ABC transporter permease [Chitinophagaceae bacterium]